jgi:hypothetical protein
MPKSDFSLSKWRRARRRHYRRLFTWLEAHGIDWHMDGGRLIYERPGRQAMAEPARSNADHLVAVG